MIPESEDTFSMPSSHAVLDQVDVAFDDERAVANAGLLLPATLAERLGIEQAADQLVDLGDRAGRGPARAQAADPGARDGRRWRLHRRRATCCAPGRPAACSAIG